MKRASLEQMSKEDLISIIESLEDEIEYLKSEIRDLQYRD